MAQSIAFPLESHALRRRQQLIRVAAHVIETEGLEAMRAPRVAELAGCARTLFYRYFPTREDLFVAILSEFQERLGERLSEPQQADGLRGLADAELSRPLLEAIWDVVAEVGSAGLILSASPGLGTELNERLTEATAGLRASWTDPLRDLGLSELAASLVSKSAVAILAELVERHRHGSITREAAIIAGQQALAALLCGLQADGGTTR